MKKRLISLLTVLAVLVFTSLTVLAETNSADLTITGDTLGSKTVTAVKMFTDNSEKSTEQAHTDPHYVLEDAWKPFFAELLRKDKDDNDLSVKAYSYVVAMENDSQALDVFAERAKNYYLERSNPNATNYIDFTNPDNDASTNDSLVLTEPATNGTVTFTSLPAGSYVVFPQSGSTSAARKTDAMFITIRTQDINKTLKSVYPTVDKKVQTIPEQGAEDDFQDNTTSKVGDYVQFQLTSQVPEMSDYTSYTFNFKDTLSKGLDFVEDDNHPLVVKIAYTVEEGGAQVTRYYTLTRTPTDPGEYSLTVTPVYEDSSNEVKDHTDLLITITNLKSLIGSDDNTTDLLKPGQDIIVTYYAKINDKAVINGTGNPNTATVESSNNPDTTETGESEPDVSKVYVYSIDIFKFTSDNNNFTSDNNNKVPLSGANFKIKKTANGKDYITRYRKQSRKHLLHN